MVTTCFSLVGIFCVVLGISVPEKEVVLIDKLPQIQLQASKTIGGSEKDRVFFYDIAKLEVDHHRNLYVVDGNHRMVILDSSGKYLREFGRKGQGPGEFREPIDIRVTNNRIYVAEMNNARIQIFSRSLQYLGSLPSLLLKGSSLAVDPHDRYIYVVNCYDTKQKSVLVFDGSKPYRFLRSFLKLRFPKKGEGYSVMTLNSTLLDCDSLGNIFVIKRPFPILYIFNSKGEELKQIEFEGERVKKIINWNRKGKTMGGHTLIANFCQDLFIDQKQNIYLLIGKNLILFYCKSRSKWYRMNPLYGSSESEEEVWFRHVASDGERLYVADAAQAAIHAFYIQYPDN